ncbi:hypothetical protein GQ53DRAFT_768720 [Thozetella sp. PMI_491]|nr:hypothetical protein GQ53DRAFT_768720 [Thozetella sp. PMI_491]
MQFQSTLTILSLAVASVHAGLQITADHETGVALQEACAVVESHVGLEKRDCRWGSCDNCYTNFSYCIGCNAGQGLSCATCLAYYGRFSTVSIAIQLSQVKFGSSLFDAHASSSDLIDPVIKEFDY